MEKHLGKFDETGLAFAREALEAADIAYSVRGDSAESRYSLPLGRMDDAAAIYDLFVDEARLAEARAAIERWQAEAEAAARRESGAALTTPEELAADADWERQQQEAKRRVAADASRPSPLVPALITFTLFVVVAVLIALYAKSRATGP